MFRYFLSLLLWFKSANKWTNFTFRIYLALSSYFFFFFWEGFRGWAVAQTTDKQQNTPGSELYADAPYRMLKTNTQGQLNPLPITIYIRDSDDGLHNNDLAFIDIKIKNARDTSFTNLLTFSSYSDTAFNSLFINPSIGNASFGIQDFWQSLPRKSTNHTIIFTSDTNWWFPPVPVVDIHERYFYFTFLIPGDKLTIFEDIIDIEVSFGLAWATDQRIYLRVFRTNNLFPVLAAWYRGDVHYHGFFTQNDAEVGLPLEATKQAAKYIGLDWLTITDHSCDFDNYGTDMQSNWIMVGQIISELNSADSSFILIRGTEQSVERSDGKLVHALVYPDDNDPFSLPYIGDGGGDLSSTSVNINMLCDSLDKYNGFFYAPHPFAEKEAVSSLLNGSVWNVCDSLLPPNGSPHPSAGTVICNDLSLESDIYDISDSLMIKNNLVGVQFWNQYNSLSTADEPYNPWNVSYESSAGFSAIPYNDPSHHLYRFNQNLDVYKVILQRGLIEKNKNPDLQNWKIFFSGGSDAHGDFNYSNTSFLDFMGINNGKIFDNAIGKITTVAYCPTGMGINGENVLKALRNGHTVISSGPLLIMTILNNNSVVALPGDDIFIFPTDYENIIVHFESATNAEFGDVISIILYIGTEDGEQHIALPLFQNTIYDLILSDLIAQLDSFNITDNKMFYLRAELQTMRIFPPEDTIIYKKSSEFYHCFTNPIWLKPNGFSDITEEYDNSVFTLYPKPANDFLTIDFKEEQFSQIAVKLFNVMGNELTNNSLFVIPHSSFIIDVSALPSGLYFIKIVTDDEIIWSRFIKL